MIQTFNCVSKIIDSDVTRLLQCFNLDLDHTAEAKPGRAACSPGVAMLDSMFQRAASLYDWTRACPR